MIPNRRLSINLVHAGEWVVGPTHRYSPPCHGRRGVESECGFLCLRWRRILYKGMKLMNIPESIDEQF